MARNAKKKKQPGFPEQLIVSSHNKGDDLFFLTYENPLNLDTDEVEVVAVYRLDRVAKASVQERR